MEGVVKQNVNFSPANLNRKPRWVEDELTRCLFWQGWSAQIVSLQLPFELVWDNLGRFRNVLLRRRRQWTDEWADFFQGCSFGIGSLLSSHQLTLKRKWDIITLSLPLPPSWTGTKETQAQIAHKHKQTSSTYCSKATKAISITLRGVK